MFDTINYRFFFVSIIFLTFFSCKTIKKNSDKPVPPVVSISEAKLSPSTKMFLSELNKEVTAQEKDFTPSENLVRNYKLSMTDGKYFIGGMLKTDGTANETETIGLGIKIGTKAGNIWTVRIPILQLEKLKTTKGIIYIQVDEQVTIKQ